MTWATRASSISSPPMRTVREVTMPPRLMIADVGRAAADVDDHRRPGLLDGQSGADRGGHRLLDDVDPPGARAQGGVLEGAALDAGDVAGHADDDAGPDQPRGGDLLDEPADHPLGDVGVGDDAVAQRAHRGDRLGRAAEHLLGPVPGREQLARAGPDGDDGGLVEDDAAAALVDDGVGRAEVDGEVPPPHPPRRPAAHASRLGRSAGSGCRAEVADRRPSRRGIRGASADAVARHPRSGRVSVRARGTRCRSRARPTPGSRTRGRRSAAPGCPSRGRGRRGSCRGAPRSGRWRRPGRGSPRRSAPPR